MIRSGGWTVGTVSMALLIGCSGEEEGDGSGESANNAGSSSRPRASVANGAALAPGMPCEPEQACDDGIDCTLDYCTSLAAWSPFGVCISVPDTPDRCTSGFCDVRTGCVTTGACAVDDDCIDTDPCTVAEHCEPSTRTCVYSILDGDGDSLPPGVCGGSDCDDDDRDVPRRENACSGRDDDCDGHVDEGLDLSSDVENCGACGVSCDSGECTNGACEPCGMIGMACCARASPPCGYERSANCEDSVCQACGERGEPCCQAGPFPSCRPGAHCRDGMCQPCGQLNDPCCPGNPPNCPVDAGCVGGSCVRCGEPGQICCESGTVFIQCRSTECIDGMCAPT